MSDGETACHVSEWIQNNCPLNVWFSIIRHSTLDDFNEKTPDMLMALIERFLSKYGKYEVRPPRQANLLFLKDYYLLRDNFVMFRSAGMVNGEMVPIIAVGVTAKIIKKKGIRL